MESVLYKETFANLLKNSFIHYLTSLLQGNRGPNLPTMILFLHIIVIHTLSLATETI